MAKKIIRKRAKRPSEIKEEVPKKVGAFPKEFLETVRELDKLKAQRKLIEDREAVLKSRIGELLEKNAYKDTKGSYLTKIDLDGADKIVKKEARKTFKLNHERAEEFFRAHKLWDFVSEKKEVINESYVEQAVNQGKITAKDFESLVDSKISYAILVRDYKPEDEEEGIL